MISLNVNRDYDKNYVVEYTIHTKDKAYVSKVIIQNINEYHTFINKILETQLNISKRRL